MNLAEDLVEISQADLSELSREVHRTGRPKLITKEGVGDLVVLAVTEYEEMREAIEVASALLEGDADIAAARLHSNAEAQDILRDRMAKAVQPVGNGRESE
jgi:prevent-host-death family protein